MRVFYFPLASVSSYFVFFMSFHLLTSLSFYLKYQFTMHIPALHFSLLHLIIIFNVSIPLSNPFELLHFLLFFGDILFILTLITMKLTSIFTFELTTPRNVYRRCLFILIKSLFCSFHIIF